MPLRVKGNGNGKDCEYGTWHPIESIVIPKNNHKITQIFTRNCIG